MKDDGYTLVEMLVAIAIIGLAFGGLSESAKVVSQLQAGAGRATSDASSRAAAQRTLSRFVGDAGPFLSTGSGGFAGKPRAFSFSCDGDVSCQAQIQSQGGETRLVTSLPGRAEVTVRIPAGAEFRYADSTGEALAWPAGQAEPTKLRSVSLIDVNASGFPIATAKLFVDEPPGCVFDVVAQGCRSAP